MQGTNTMNDLSGLLVASVEQAASGEQGAHRLLPGRVPGQAETCADPGEALRAACRAVEVRIMRYRGRRRSDRISPAAPGAVMTHGPAMGGRTTAVNRNTDVPRIMSTLLGTEPSARRRSAEAGSRG